MDWGRKCLPVLLAVSDMEDEMYFLCVCVCQRVTDADSVGIEWSSTVLARSYFPITSWEQE